MSCTARKQAVTHGMWPVVVFNILLFLFFAISFIRPKKKVEWRTMGAFAGFLVALFTEMYGFPLTIAPSGILIMGIPLEEYLFAFGFGMLWSSLYEHIQWQRIA